MTALLVTVLASCWLQFFIGFWQWYFWRRKKGSKKSCFLHSYPSLIRNEKWFTYLVVSCNWHTLCHCLFYETLYIIYLCYALVSYCILKRKFEQHWSTLPPYINKTTNHIYFKSLNINRPLHMDMEIQILVWDRHKSVVGNDLII